MRADWLGGIGEAFADRNFRVYSLGAIVSWLSFFVQVVAMSWTTWTLTHSTTWLAVIAALDIAPTIVLLPFGGVLADRIDRFTIVVVTHLLALGQSLALALLAGTDHLGIGPLAALALAHGSVHSFSVPGLYGMLPRFVAREQLPSAIAVSSAYTNFAVFAGPALAGWIILHWGVSAAFASNVFGYAFYLATIAFLRTPATYAPPRPTGRTVFGDLLDGARYIAAHRGIRPLLTLTLAGDAVATATMQLLPAYADRVLGQGIAGVSALMSAAGAGATLSALWLAHGGARRATPDRVLGAFVAHAGAVGLLALAWGPAVALAAMLAYGMAGEIRRTGTVSLLQLAVDDRQRGRVMATQFLMQRVAGGLGVLAVGTVADHAGLRAPLLAAAGCALFVGAVTFWNRNRMASASPLGSPSGGG